jgi:hypothetical protein
MTIDESEKPVVLYLRYTYSPADVVAERVAVIVGEHPGPIVFVSTGIETLVIVTGLYVVSSTAIVSLFSPLLVITLIV